MQPDVGDGPPIEVLMPMLTLVPGGMGGSETYARELVREVSKIPDIRLVTGVSKQAGGFSAEVATEIVSTRVRGGASSFARVRTLAQASVPTPALRRAFRRADVVHFPLTVPIPSSGGAPTIHTIHDVQHHDLPALFTRSELAYRRLMYDIPARRAAAVVTISEFSKRQIIDHLRLPPERVHVAHLAVNAMEFTPYKGPRDDFVLYPARAWPHKNHRRLIQAMHVVRQTYPQMRLILTGGDLEGLGPLPEWVENRGLVPRAELLRLYQRAACLAFPSRYEGFGLPPLEAMASGCPVAAADSGALPEVCGDAAILFDPDSTSEMARAILRSMTERDMLVAAGFRQCSRFSWRGCAAVHARLYRQLAKRVDR